MGMTASDWPVSHVVKRSQTIDPNPASLLSIVVSGLIMRLKAKELCSDPDFKASLGREDHSKCAGSQMLLMQQTEDDAIYNNKMLQVADDDMEDEFETDGESKKKMKTKNFNCMKFSQTKGSFRSHCLNKSH